MADAYFRFSVEARCNDSSVIHLKILSVNVKSVSGKAKP